MVCECVSVFMRERGREGERGKRERERERERKVFTNRMLFSALIGTVVISMLLVCTQYTIVCTYFHALVYYLLDHMCHQDPGWSQVDTDSRCKYHTRHWASWIDSQCTHTSTRTHTTSHTSTYQYVNAKIHGFFILTHKMINIH